jgi:hypothetical protein
MYNGGAWDETSTDVGQRWIYRVLLTVSGKTGLQPIATDFTIVEFTLSKVAQHVN